MVQSPGGRKEGGSDVKIQLQQARCIMHVVFVVQGLEP